MASNRIPWEPAIYEHKAALIGRSVEEVARDAGLLVEALLTERETYQADFLTVGVDVYNIEAEACGLKVAASSPEACPEASSPLWNLDSLPGELPLPDVRRAGRFPMMVEAGRRAVAALGQACRVRVAASGPMSLAAKLVGLENLIVAMALDEPPAARILEFAARLAEAWCAELRRNGLDVIVFDSAAAPPVTSPALYAVAVLPLHRRLLAVLERTGQRDRPLIVGGNST
ncbi:MAG TPA: uroporphyrinogen decarboxylase family protein, partial [Phycisphaerae bacterium]|nr:uroporphyrinogen decarboxylase family protein [Phycisphaerae bacterium]